MLCGGQRRGTGGLTNEALETALKGYGWWEWREATGLPRATGRETAWTTTRWLRVDLRRRFKLNFPLTERAQGSERATLAAKQLVETVSKHDFTKVSATYWFGTIIIIQAVMQQGMIG